MLGYDECIKLVLSYDIVSDTKLVNVDGITLGLDIRTELGYLDGSFDFSNVGKLEGLFLEYALRLTWG